MPVPLLTKFFQNFCAPSTPAAAPPEKAASNIAEFIVCNMSSVMLGCLGILFPSASNLN